MIFLNFWIQKATLSIWNPKATKKNFKLFKFKISFHTNIKCLHSKMVTVNKSNKQKLEKSFCDTYNKGLILSDIRRFLQINEKSSTIQ